MSIKTPTLGGFGLRKMSVNRDRDDEFLTSQLLGDDNDDRLDVIQEEKESPPKLVLKHSKNENPYQPQE